MSSETLSSADHKMARAVEAMERDFQGIRTGRASTANTKQRCTTGKKSEKYGRDWLPQHRKLQ